MQKRLIILGVCLACVVGCGADDDNPNTAQGNEAAAAVPNPERVEPGPQPPAERLQVDAETAERMEHVATKLRAAGRAEQAAYVEEQLRIHSTHDEPR